MRLRGLPVSSIAALIVALRLVVGAGAVVPRTMNYQVMLTDDADQPLANQAVTLEFGIYDDPEVGTLLWSEVHNVETNSIGVVSVLLGSTNPLAIAFDAPLWLQVEVDGHAMVPRRELASASSALTAHDSEFLGGVPAEAYALDDDIYQPGTLNDPTNPLEWTKLKNMPSGFADGVDDVGTGVGGGGTAGYLARFTGASSVGNSIIQDDGVHVTIGTPVFDARLAVEQGAPTPALYLINTQSAETPSVLEMSRQEPMDETGDGMLLIQVPDTSTNGGLIVCRNLGTSTATTVFSVDHEGHVRAAEGLFLSKPSAHARTLEAVSDYASSDARVLSGTYIGTGDFDAVAVYGECKPQDYYGYGGRFIGGYTGVTALVQPSGPNMYFGVRGECNGGTGTNYGVYAGALGGGENYGVFANAAGGTSNWAGYFTGDVRVTGNLINPSPALEIDHPDDPEGSYLRHALVASPEMKTVYDGTVALDSEGSAWVQLPSWFESLNGDFRYQLTPIGGPAPGLHIAETIVDNRFRVAGGEPGMTVSWLVTGVRKDATAVGRPLVVEERKAGNDRGRYVDPAAFGASSTLTVGHLDERKESD